MKQADKLFFIFIIFINAESQASQAFQQNTFSMINTFMLKNYIQCHVIIEYKWGVINDRIP